MDSEILVISNIFQETILIWKYLEKISVGKQNVAKQYNHSYKHANDDT